MLFPSTIINCDLILRRTPLLIILHQPCLFQSSHTACPYAFCRLRNKRARTSAFRIHLLRCAIDEFRVPHQHHTPGNRVVLEKPFHDPASYSTPAASSLATCSLYKSLQILVLTTRGPMVDEKARHELKFMADSHWRSPPPRKRTTTIAKPHKSKSTAKLELQHSEPRLLQCAACRFGSA